MIENEKEVVEQEVVETVEQEQFDDVEENEVEETEETSNNSVEEDDSEEEEVKVVEKEKENLRTLRLAKIKAEKELNDLRSFVEKNAKQQQQYQQPQYQPPQQQQPQPHYQPPQQQQPQYPQPIAIDDDAIVSGSDLNNQRLYYENLIKESNKGVEARIAAQEQQSRAAAAARALVNDHDDFFDVVTNDNLMLLKDEDPRLYNYLNNNQGDMYEQGKLSYKYIKMLGLHKDDMTTSIKNRISKNAKLPRSTSTISPQKNKSSLSSAASHAHRKMSEQEKKEQRRILNQILGT